MRLSGKGKQRGVFTVKSEGEDLKRARPQGVGRSLAGEARITPAGQEGCRGRRAARQKGKGVESLLACVSFTFYGAREGEGRGDRGQAFTNTYKEGS